MDQKKRRPVDGSEKNGLCWWIKNGLLLINWKRKFSCWWLRRKRPTVDRSEKGLLLMGQKKKSLSLDQNKKVFCWWIREKRSRVDGSDKKSSSSCWRIRKKGLLSINQKKMVPCWWIKKGYSLLMDQKCTKYYKTKKPLHVCKSSFQ